MSVKTELCRKFHNMSPFKISECKMSNLSEETVKNIILSSTQPLIFKGFSSEWALTKWDLDKWCTIFGDKVIPFRCFKKDVVSDEPIWERKCVIRHMKFKTFLDSIETSPEWMYFDYKYLHQWFNNENDLYKEICWKKYGFPNKGAIDTTCWVGSKGAHTPAHQDTYGCNLVVQIHGTKRWILFPPESGNMRPTRVPYEESSVYSELNFYSPSDLEPFKTLSGARSVVLSPGDALVVPNGWWHYVEHTSNVAITLNMWLPHETDMSTRVSEALIRIMVTQICKDLPPDTTKLLINPNEDELPDTPLAVLFLQLETVTKTYLDSRRKTRRLKRQKTCEEEPSSANSTSDEVEIESLIADQDCCIDAVPTLSTADLLSIVGDRMRKRATESEDDVDGDLMHSDKLCLTKAFIDAYCQRDLLQHLKQNLIARLT